MKTAQFIGGPRDGERIAVPMDRHGRPEMYIIVYEMEEKPIDYYDSATEIDEITYVPRKTRQYMLAEMDDGQLFYLLMK